MVMLKGVTTADTTAAHCSSHIAVCYYVVGTGWASLMRNESR